MLLCLCVLIYVKVHCVLISAPKLLPKPTLILHSWLFSMPASTDFPFTECLRAPLPGLLPPSKCQLQLAGKKGKAECEDVPVLFLTLDCFCFCFQEHHHQHSFWAVWSMNGIQRTVLSLCHWIRLHLSPYIRGCSVSMLRAPDRCPSQ